LTLKYENSTEDLKIDEEIDGRNPRREPRENGPRIKLLTMKVMSRPRCGGGKDSKTGSFLSLSLSINFLLREQ